MIRRETAALRAAFLLLLLAIPCAAWAGDGGYIMLTSSDPGGPAVDWIDISTTGTLVTGLADDNSAPGTLALPQAFHYFGGDYSAIKIGSNGWIGFENTLNIAACFVPIPTPGNAGDTYLAPFVADLNFTGAGNPGTVRTFHDSANDRFIISYIDVPYWNISAPGWSGSTNFQVVLEFASRSIRFNYETMTAPLFNAACIDVVVGVEGPGGVDGVQHSNDTAIPSNFSILFLAPGTIDVTPTSGLVTTESGTTASFDVVLASQPTADVTIPVSSTDTSEGMVSESSLMFTPMNWDVPQSVIVTGVNDASVDGSIPFSITLGTATSTAPNYNGLDPSDVAVTNTDDDIAHVIAGDVNAFEGTGSDPQFTFDVTVDIAVDGGFTIPYSTADGSASSSDYTAASGVLTFVGNAGETQSVSVTVSGDSAVESDETFVLNLGTPSHAGVQVTDAQGLATILDDDSADLAVTMSDTPDPVASGGQIVYTMQVSNAGPGPAANAQLTDVIPAGTTFVNAVVSQGANNFDGTSVTANFGTILASASATLTLTVDVTGPLTSTTITNNATVTTTTTDPNATNDSASEETTVSVPDLVVSNADSPDPVVTGSDITYTIGVTNSGSLAATDVELTDVIPAGTTYVSAVPSQGSINFDGTTLTATLGTIAPSGSASVSLTLNVTAPASSVIPNTATATAAEPELNTSNNTSTATTNVVAAEADLAITKIDTPDPVLVGGQIIYTVTVTNNGTIPADGVQLTDVIPAGTTYVSASVSAGSVNFDGTTVTANFGTINVGSSVQLTLTVSVDGPLSEPIVTNTANVTTTSAEPNTANNSATAATAVSAANLTVTKTGAPSQVTPGSNITYTITLANTGDLSATNVSLNDTVPASTTFVSFTVPAGWTPSTPVIGGTGVVSATTPTLAAGASAVFTLVVRVDLTAPIGTTVTNTATATSSTSEVVTADNAANESTTVAAANVAGIPTLDARGLAMLAVAMAAIAFVILKRA